ncbi:hypothetical protein FHT70_002593 [Rhizobium sp. BK049]|nr:hypothetical protein [Rhizobium sp. BK049]
MPRGNGAVLVLNSGRRCGHAERIRRHQKSDEDNLDVAEDSPKSHSAGFPFRLTTARRQKCSRHPMIRTP